MIFLFGKTAPVKKKKNTPDILNMSPSNIPIFPGKYTLKMVDFRPLLGWFHWSVVGEDVSPLFTCSTWNDSMLFFLWQLGKKNIG